MCHEIGRYSDYRFAHSKVITDASLVSLAVSPVSRTISLGESKQYFSTASYANSSTTDVTNTSVWTSSNPSVATISTSGLAISKGQGTTTIGAAIGSVSSSTTLTVGPVAVVTAKINGSMAYSILDGQQIQLSATATFSDGSSADITNLAVWSAPFTAVFNETIATVGNSVGAKGLVTTLGSKGTTQISMSYGGITDTVFVAVN